MLAAPGRAGAAGSRRRRAFRPARARRRCAMPARGKRLAEAPELRRLADAFGPLEDDQLPAPRTSAERDDRARRALLDALDDPVVHLQHQSCRSSPAPRSRADSRVAPAPCSSSSSSCCSISGGRVLAALDHLLRVDRGAAPSAAAARPLRGRRSSASFARLTAWYSALCPISRPSSRAFSSSI